MRCGECRACRWYTWMRGLDLGFTNHVDTGECWTCVCVYLRWCGWCRWCRWVVDRGLGQGSGGVVWCYVCVRCESGFSLAGQGICVLCLADTCASEVHPVFNPVSPRGYLLPNLYLFIADINESRLVYLMLSDLD